MLNNYITICLITALMMPVITFSQTIVIVSENDSLTGDIEVHAETCVPPPYKKGLRIILNGMPPPPPC